MRISDWSSDVCSSDLTGLIHHEDKADKQAAKTDAVSFQPPPMSAIPDGPEGESIRRGMAIFTNTGTNAKQFVGNGLSCQNCHLEIGRASCRERVLHYV